MANFRSPRFYQNKKIYQKKKERKGTVASKATPILAGVKKGQNQD